MIKENLSHLQSLQARHRERPVGATDNLVVLRAVDSSATLTLEAQPMVIRFLVGCSAHGASIGC